MSASDSQVAIRYAVPRWSPAWAIPEVPVPESEVHDAAIEYLRALLRAWAEREGRACEVLRNIGIRWVQEEPRAGFDPDLCLLEPHPHPEEGLNSLRLWEPEVNTPRLAIEVVSPGHPYKDYVDTPERAAACGITELWVYDPLMAGPKKHGGPFLIQIWRSTPNGFERIHAGAGAAFSPELGAWLHPRASRRPSEARLLLCDDAEGQQPWSSLEEQRAHTAEQTRLDAERRRMEAEQRRMEAEQRAAEALRELAELRRRTGQG